MFRKFFTVAIPDDKELLIRGAAAILPLLKKGKRVEYRLETDGNIAMITEDYSADSVGSTRILGRKEKTQVRS